MGLKKAEIQSSHAAPTSSGQDIQELLMELASLSPLERRLSARMLAGRPEALQPLLDALKRETVLAAQSAMLQALIQIPGGHVVDELLTLVHTADITLRNNIIMSLWTRPLELVMRIQPWLHSGDPDHRIMAINMLSGTRNPIVTPFLLDIIEYDSELNVVITALDGLAEVGTADLIPKIEAVSNRFSGDSFVSFAIEATLERLREAA